MGQLRAAFPQAKLRVRLDAGFACPRTFLVLEELGVEYVVAMAGNVRLDQLAAPLLRRARRSARRAGKSARTFGAFRYAPLKNAWPRERRVVVKAEVVVHPGRDPRDNPRYVVTNLRLQAERVYSGVYCARGDVENRIKELNLGLALGRTSCSRS